MTFGGDYGYKDGTVSIILSACTESIRLSAHTESIILSALPAKSLILSAPPAESMILSAHAESMILSVHAESIILSSHHAESIILSSHHSNIIILSLHYPENIIFSAPIGCVIRQTAAATKKPTIGNTIDCRFTTLVNIASMAPPIGLPPKGAEFCHTLNILLVGHQCHCALLQLYFNSSVDVGQQTIRVSRL
jgi:hypothetical protein